MPIAGLERNLRLCGRPVIGIHYGGLDVDERAQALVLAEIAARRLIARGLVLNLRAGFETDERALAAVVPQAAGFECGTDPPRLAAMLVDDDLRRVLLAFESRLDEVHLRLHRGEV